MRHDVFDGGMMVRNFITMWRWGGGAHPGMWTVNCDNGFEVVFQACVVDDFGSLVRVAS